MNQHPLSTEDAISIWQAGLEAVGASRLVRDSFALETLENGVSWLSIGDEIYDLPQIDRLLVVGAGKAGSAMAAGLEQAIAELLCDQVRTGLLQIDGLINVPESTQKPLQHIRLNEARPAGVNEPTERGIWGSREILRLVSEANSKVGCVVLLSGGGSALLPLPTEGIGLAEKLAVTRLLSSSGATIDQLNTVRKHLSGIKGGKLALASRAAWMHTLVVSDVLGDPLDLIASGPTVPDTSTANGALQILRKFDIDNALPGSVYKVLENPAEHLISNSECDPTQWPQNQAITVIGNNAVAVDSAGMEAERRGYNHVMTSSKQSEGLAEEIGYHLAEMAISMVTELSGNFEGATSVLSNNGLLNGLPNCLISGGEPVVRLAPANIRGRGGRNQQLVLAALDRWMKEPPEMREKLKRYVTLLSAGTDGEDGPTDAAGAFVNVQVWMKAESLGLSPPDYLRTNNAYAFFEQSGGLLITGPTGTNVCDVRVLTIR